jgi:hypothetical protein
MPGEELGRTWFSGLGRVADLVTRSALLPTFFRDLLSNSTTSHLEDNSSDGYTGQASGSTSVHLALAWLQPMAYIPPTDMPNDQKHPSPYPS